MEIGDMMYIRYLSERQVQDRNFPVSPDILDVLKYIEEEAEEQAIDEASYNDIIDKEVLKIELMDIKRFIKQNNVKEITNPTFFGSSGQPTPDGLLSNEIFGITQADRSGIFGYIDLVEDFIDPSCYKTLIRLNKKFLNIVHATKKYTIDENGELVEDNENGGTGIKWLKNNFEKLSLYIEGASRKRDVNIEYLALNFKKGRMFINKYIVIPPYYRDVNTSGKNVGVGQINKLYVNLIVGATSLKENNDYGLSMADSTCARMQETLKAIYDWFCGNQNQMVTDPGTGMARKFGIIKRANLSKTTDYSSRLVMSAPELKVETVDDLMATLDKSVVPMAAVITDFYPFIMFHLRRFFENEFLNVTQYPIYVNGEIVMAPLKNPMMKFDDDRLKDEIKQFLYSYDTRFQPIEAPIDYEKAGLDPSKEKVYMAFKGVAKNEEYGENPEPITKRRLTWVDALYIAAVKASDGKMISFTRYPVDTFYNTFYTGIEVASTIKTEPVYINGEFYPHYPRIRDDEILGHTENKFVDTMQMCNLFLKSIGGDYDGDTGVVKGSYFKETNEELHNFANSKINFVDLSCTNIKVSSNESVQSIYNLTKVLYEDKDKLTEPEF